MIDIREVDPAKERHAVSLLIANYLRQTESEKAERGLAESADAGALPSHYEREIADPSEAFRDCRVFVATDDDVPAGIVVVTSVDDRAEIKRLWVEPGHRGKSIASLLLGRVVSSTDAGVLRLTVWEWREPALALYEKLGFVRVKPWERRPELVCLERTR